MNCACRFAVPVIALVAIGVVPASSSEPPAFDGVYIARGVDSDGQEYRRAVDIERRGDRFVVTCVSAQIVGEAVVLVPTWFGIGIVTRDTLSVSFIARDMLGIIVYRFDPDGQQLHGRWTLEGDDEAIHSETLTRLPDVRPEPAAVEPE